MLTLLHMHGKVISNFADVLINHSINVWFYLLNLSQCMLMNINLECTICTMGAHVIE